MLFLYDTILYKPLLNALVFFYNTIALEDLGLAIIYLTILVRVLLFPLFHKSARHQTVMQKLQPEIKRIQDAHRHEKEKQVEKMLALYKENKINPFAGFLLLLVQLPVLIALYRIFIDVSRPDFLDHLYRLITRPDSLNPLFLGLLNLGEKSILMVGIAALAQYFQAKLALPRPEAGRELTQAEKTSRAMVFVGPAITILIFYNFPAAVTLYWAASSIFSVFQQAMINKQLKENGLGKPDKKIG